MAAGLYFRTNNIFIYLTIDFVLVNREDPDEMQRHDAFHLGLQCLSMYPCLGVSSINYNLYQMPWTGSYVLQSDKIFYCHQYKQTVSDFSRSFCSTAAVQNATFTFLSAYHQFNACVYRLYPRYSYNPKVCTLLSHVIS